LLNDACVFILGKDLLQTKVAATPAKMHTCQVDLQQILAIYFLFCIIHLIPRVMRLHFFMYG